YDAVTDGAAFAKLLTDHLHEVSHDKHLRIAYSAQVIPSDAGDEDPAVRRARYRSVMESRNCGFESVEQSPDGIGYLKFNTFGSAEVCAPTAIAAMNFLANAKALIVDLRQNGGGSADMVPLLSSYLFAEPTHLNDLWNR